MIKDVAHIGITVSNIERSKKFYGEVLGLKFLGEMVMKGEATDFLFSLNNCAVKVAYFAGGKNVEVCPAIKLLEFVNNKALPNSSKLNRISISEMCFTVANLDEFCAALDKKDVKFNSLPQLLDFTDQGYGRTKCVYLKDPDGNILGFTEKL